MSANRAGFLMGVRIGAGGGPEKPNPRPGIEPGGDSDRYRVAEKRGFEPRIPLWGILT